MRSYQYRDLPNPYWSSFNCRWVASAPWRKNSLMPDTYRLPIYCRLLFRWACSYFIDNCCSSPECGVWQGGGGRKQKLEKNYGNCYCALSVWLLLGSHSYTTASPCPSDEIPKTVGPILLLICMRVGPWYLCQREASAKTKANPFPRGTGHVAPGTESICPQILGWLQEYLPAALGYCNLIFLSSPFGFIEWICSQK